MALKLVYIIVQLDSGLDYVELTIALCLAMKSKNSILNH